MNLFEFLAVAVLLSCVIMLLRRNVLKLKRFWSAEMTSWPRLDANIILITEIVLMVAILTMNASDQLLQARSVEHYSTTGPLLFSGLFTPHYSTQHFDTNSHRTRGLVASYCRDLGFRGLRYIFKTSPHFPCFSEYVFCKSGIERAYGKHACCYERGKNDAGLGEATPSACLQLQEDLVPKISMIWPGIICWRPIRAPNVGDVHRNVRQISREKSFRREKL